MRVTTTSSEEREGIEVGPSGKVAVPSSFDEAMRNGEDALETGDYPVAVNAFSGLRSCASRNRERP